MRAVLYFVKILEYIFSTSFGGGPLNTSLVQYRIEKMAICSKIGVKAIAFSVSTYSILTGVSSYTFLFINPSFSISLSLNDRVFGFICSIESMNWLNRVCFSNIMFRKSKRVNFLPIILRVLLIGQHLHIFT